MLLIELQGHVDYNPSKRQNANHIYIYFNISKDKSMYLNLERVFGLRYLCLSVNLCDFLILIKFLLHVQASLNRATIFCCSVYLCLSLTDFVFFIYSSHKCRKQKRLMPDEK